MDKETLAALDASIEHWKENLRAETPHDVKLGAHHCPLCQLFIVKNEKCDGCPIFETTGYYNCARTPYSKASNTRGWWAFGSSTKAEWEAAAQAEIDFLLEIRNEACAE